VDVESNDSVESKKYHVDYFVFRRRAASQRDAHTQSAIVLKWDKDFAAVVWVRADEQRLFELFPEVLMLDITFGTNSGVVSCSDG
jgi:hypothetical protein